MPSRPPRRCVVTGCPHPIHYRGRCKSHQPEPWARYSPDPDRPKGRAWVQLATHILERDHRICYVCGDPGANQVDHKIPIAEGGAKWHPSNLGAIHDEPCHRDKSRDEALRGARRRQKARKAPHREA